MHPSGGRAALQLHQNLGVLEIETSLSAVAPPRARPPNPNPALRRSKRQRPTRSGEPSLVRTSSVRSSWGEPSQAGPKQVEDVLLVELVEAGVGQVKPTRGGHHLNSDIGKPIKDKCFACWPSGNTDRTYTYCM